MQSLNIFSNMKKFLGNAKILKSLSPVHYDMEPYHNVFNSPFHIPTLLSRLRNYLPSSSEEYGLQVTVGIIELLTGMRRPVRSWAVEG